MRPSNISFLQFSSQRQLIFLLLFCFIILSILSFDVSSALQGASEVETDLIEDDQIVVPWKKLYRPRGPPLNKKSKSMTAFFLNENIFKIQTVNGWLSSININFI
ncbi:hypothetical protein Mgra_00000908 [Meloidogyne graminicola]|uniref:Uncharacterized protein n=1 Tax=Meloidogyne graminicola TaxID=189291 RepID=A0A8T0A2P4_9BILA|nr:hypothetical protein Mgra_00000908 [Meloidogyne graminicola]